MYQMLISFSIALILTIIDCQPTNSDSCLQYNNNLSICEACIDGFYLDYFYCVPCAPMCQCQNRDDYCLTCMSLPAKDGLIELGTYQTHLKKDKTQQYCRFCHIDIPNCLTCTSSLHCTSCMNGTYIISQLSSNISIDYCSNITCTANCQVCASNISCSLCEAGHYITVVNNVSLCSADNCLENCTICESNQSCQLCQPYFYQENGTCLACAPNCTVCNDSDTCTECYPGTYFINGSCEATDAPNCIKMAGGYYNPTCLICQPGYYNLAGSCTECQGCQICSTSFICYSQCYHGYKKFNFACVLDTSLYEINKLSIEFYIYIIILVFCLQRI